MERRLNLPQNLKERNLNTKLEIKAIDNQISDIEDIKKLYKIPLREKIIELLQLATREVPDQIQVSEPNVSDEFKE